LSSLLVETSHAAFAIVALKAVVEAIVVAIIAVLRNTLLVYIQSHDFNSDCDLEIFLCTFCVRLGYFCSWDFGFEIM